MALPVVDTKAPGVKELIQGSVKEIANTIFATASVSITAAAKAVTPSIPQMVADITEDLRAGPVDRFSKGLEKLDKLLQNFGGDIKDYSKELGKFVDQREARISKSEKTIRELRESNVKAEIGAMGEINILSQEEIRKREEAIETLNTQIKTDKQDLEIKRKLIQEQGVASGEGISKDVVDSQNAIIEKEQKREKLLESLNKTEEETSNDAQMSIRERASQFVDDYVPDQIRDIGGALVDGLMAPVNAVKDLGMFFGNLLKPLKFLMKPLKAMGTAFKALGKTLFGFIKKAAVMFKSFIMGMMGAIVSMLPFIAIGAAIVAAIALVIVGLVKLMQVIEDNKLKLIEFKDKIMAIPGQIKDFFTEKFALIGEAFNNFVEDVKAIPGKISDFFKGVFAKIQNFFIDMINSVITLINDKLGIFGVNIDPLENVPMPDSPAEIVSADSKGTVSAAQSGAVSTAGQGLPFLNTNNSQSSVNNAAAVINNNAVNNNTTNSMAASARNDDYSRFRLYGAMAD